MADPQEMNEEHRERREEILDEIVEKVEEIDELNQELAEFLSIYDGADPDTIKRFRTMMAAEAIIGKHTEQPIEQLRMTDRLREKKENDVAEAVTGQISEQLEGALNSLNGETIDLFGDDVEIEVEKMGSVRVPDQEPAEGEITETKLRKDDDGGILVDVPDSLEGVEEMKRVSKVMEIYEKSDSFEEAQEKVDNKFNEEDK